MSAASVHDGIVLAAGESASTGSDWWGIFWLVVLLLGNAYFVAAEFAVISARRSQIEPRAEQGSRAACPRSDVLAPTRRRTGHAARPGHCRPDRALCQAEGGFQQRPDRA